MELQGRICMGTGSRDLAIAVYGPQGQVNVELAVALQGR